jgi:phosphatidylglycerophosphatase A
LLWLAAALGLHLPAYTLEFWLLTAIAAALLAGVPAASIVEHEAGTQDPGFVVIDEVIGQWIALLGSAPNWRHALIALSLFRLFDITKPFPVRLLEKLPAGWGIIFDDVAAGLYAWGAAALLRLWIH